jgi:uncharacterized protein YjbJ (UPF0337 family)
VREPRPPAAEIAREGINRQRDSDMDKNRIAGAAKQANCAVKEVTGKAVGDAKLVAVGKSNKVEDIIQHAEDGLKGALKK